MLNVVMLSVTILAPDGTNVQYFQRLRDIQQNDNQLNVTQQCITHQSGFDHNNEHGIRYYFTNGAAYIRHQCRDTTVINCHRCLINTGVENMSTI